MQLGNTDALLIVLLFLLLAVAGAANGQTQMPVVTATKTAAGPINPDDQFWASISGTTIKTSGNPLNGGHGSIPLAPDILIKAAYTDTDLFMFFEWSDATNDNIYAYWKYDVNQQRWIGSNSDKTSEDRLYLA